MEHTYKGNSITILKSSHKEIRRIKYLDHHPSIHGNKFWRSSLLLMDYLKHHPLKKGSSVIEIGCGWGLAGIYCAKFFNAKVSSIDADADVFPYLELHARFNKVKVKTEKNKFEKLTTARLSGEEIIIGADICFWKELVKPLYNFLERASRAGVKKVIIADPGRWTFENFSELCIKTFNARTEEWSVTKPIRAVGTLLIVNNL